MSDGSDPRLHQLVQCLAQVQKQKSSTEKTEKLLQDSIIAALSGTDSTAETTDNYDHVALPPGSKRPRSEPRLPAIGLLEEFATTFPALYRVHNSMALDMRQLRQNIGSLFADLFPNDIPDLPQRMLGNVNNLKQTADQMLELIEDAVSFPEERSKKRLKPADDHKTQL